MGEEFQGFPFVKRTDPVSGLDEQAFSFLLKYYIPTERLRELQQSHFFEELQKTMDVFVEEISHSKPVELQAEILPSGSSAEGLSVPVLYDRRTGSSIWNSDFDMMRVLPICVAFGGTCIGDLETLETSRNEVYCLRPASHPGFVKLFVINGTIKGTFLNSQKWEPLEIVKQLSIVMPQDGVELSMHGPACTSESEKLTVDLDHVYAVRCPNWPKAASKWTCREHRSGWPSRVLVQEIVSGGCHVVAAGHPLSTESHLEWRLSFSMAEKELARSLTWCQKKAYAVVKILHREYFSLPKVIVTYHLKNILFWACERLPESFWTESNMASCVFALLDNLILCLGKHELPNFFIPENNMIGHVHHDFIKTALKKLIAVRENPMKAIFDLDLKYRLVRGPRKPWKSSFEILNTALSERGLCDGEMVLNFSFISLDVANLFVTQSGRTEWGVKEAFFFLKEAWLYHQILSKNNAATSVSLLTFLCLKVSEMFNAMSSHPVQVFIQSLINMVEYILSTADTDSDVKGNTKEKNSRISHLRSLAGTLCHALAFWSPIFDRLPKSPPLSNQEREDAKEKSEMHHNVAIGMMPNDICMKTEYAKLLFHRDSFKELVELVEPFVEHLSLKENTKITKVELATLEVNLQKIVRTHMPSSTGCIVVPNAVIALYYLTLAHTKMASEKAAIARCTEKLELLCHDKENKAAKFTRDLYKTLI